MDASRHSLALTKYVSLTTFRRTGAPVTTPVWIAPATDGSDHLVVITVDGTGKTKRLGHTSRVELRPCDVRGRVADAAPTYAGEAEVVRDPAGVAAVRAAVVAKYGWQARVSDVVDTVAAKVGVHRGARAGIVITVEAEPRAGG